MTVNTVTITRVELVGALMNAFTKFGNKGSIELGEVADSIWKDLEKLSELVE